MKLYIEKAVSRGAASSFACQTQRRPMWKLLCSCRLCVRVCLCVRVKRTCESRVQRHGEHNWKHLHIAAMPIYIYMLFAHLRCVIARRYRQARRALRVVANKIKVYFIVCSFAFADSFKQTEGFGALLYVSLDFAPFDPLTII